ncbi:MAG: hypothetical protein EU539_01390 [Promethearchaeota archaeon]|nr:MAG: hypothetical protein EU539_01390 [Candidatus Lokiarchaeota archaeon]
MTSFRVIPVIDILNSEAVHAKKGERNKYAPLKSKILDTTDPFKIVKSLKEKFDFSEIYIADLDSILKKKANFHLLKKIMTVSDVKILLDPGIINKDDILNFSNLKLHKLIVGLETIKSLEVIKEIINILGEDKLILSVDMYDGRIISRIKNLNKKNPLDYIINFKKLGVKELLLLDLFRVGQKIGSIPPLYLEIQKIYESKLLVGGGIKSLEDIKNYKDHKFSGILLATALYDGTINIKELKESNFNR